MAEGALVQTADAGEGAVRMVFRRKAEGVEVTTMVIARENWALIASATGKTIR